MINGFIKLRLAIASGFAGAALLAQPVPAQQVPAPLRFEVRAWPDAAILGAGTAAVYLRSALRDRLPSVKCAPCDPSGIWGVDRAAVGLPRTPAQRASNLLRAGASWGAGTLIVLARGRGAGVARLEDLVVFAEVLNTTNAATAWMKVLVQRPRPERYVAVVPDSTALDDSFAFPSGHASQAFAAAAAYASILHRRGALGRHKTEIVALFALAAATGAMRVAAHKHFPTDVVAGAALGTAIGWTLPAIHATR